MLALSIALGWQAARQCIGRPDRLFELGLPARFGDDLPAGLSPVPKIWIELNQLKPTLARHLAIGLVERINGLLAFCIQAGIIQGCRHLISHGFKNCDGSIIKGVRLLALHREGPHHAAT